jgi:hypothetical protein
MIPAGFLTLAAALPRLAVTLALALLLALGTEVAVKLTHTC